MKNLWSKPEDAILAKTLPGRLILLAETFETRTAIREKHRGIWRPYSWRDYANHVARTAEALIALGVVESEHVAILSDNRPEWLFADLAAQAIGARAVGIYQTNNAEDVAFVLNDAKVRVIVCEDQEQVDKVVAVDAPSVEHIVVIDPRGTNEYDDPRLISWNDAVPERCDFEAFRESVRGLDAEEPAMVVYTSGTTGNPKGALISSRNVVEISSEIAPWIGATERDSVLSYLPLCHVAEKIFTFFLPLTVGAVVHFGESIETVREDLREVSPTIFLGVPRIWEKIHAGVTLKMKDASWLKRTLYKTFTNQGSQIAKRRREQKLTGLDRIVWFFGDLLVFRALQERLGMRRCRVPISGAAPISAELIEWFWSIGIPISEGYGQTECAGVSHINPPNDVKIGSVGRPLPLVECIAADDGEILLRGPMVFCGYLNRDSATDGTISDEGWLHTGDIGTIDDRGFLNITGRKKEIIITAGGKNLSPERIENAVKLSPYVKEAVAIGDGKKFVSALIQIDFESVSDWASRNNIAFNATTDLPKSEEVVSLVSDAVKDANAHLSPVEQVKAFRLLPRALDQDDGEVTATQKVRRNVVLERYESLVTEMY